MVLRSSGRKLRGGLGMTLRSRVRFPTIPQFSPKVAVQSNPRVQKCLCLKTDLSLILIQLRVKILEK